MKNGDHSNDPDLFLDSVSEIKKQKNNFKFVSSAELIFFIAIFQMLTLSPRLQLSKTKM